MKQPLTVVMYHYVRDLKKSDYPDIKGLELSLFKKQLDYFSRFYKFVSINDCLLTLKNKINLPRNAILLTFDDGYIDHYENVFPLLKKKGISGCFFVTCQSTMENKLLDVNKIQFILASNTPTQVIILEIFTLLDGFRKKYKLCSNNYYYNKLATSHSFDPPEIGFIKRILQYELPEIIRKEIIDAFFKKYVSSNEKSFAKSLYLNPSQIKEMKKSGMCFGVHGYTHRMLNTMNAKEQKIEIAKSVAFLKKLDVIDDDWITCYPSGRFNKSLISILKKEGCKMAFTIEARIADLKLDDPLSIPRLDTNHLPKDKNAKPNEWTKKILKK